MDQQIVIETTNLTKSYPLYENSVDRLKEAINPFGKKYHKLFNALHDVNIEVSKGDVVGIIGKNGSGKSTLLKLLTGVLTPTSGSVQVRGKISALLELGAGFNPEMTGIENIFFNGTVIGFTHKEMEQKLPGIIEFADIGEFIHQPVKTYSSGMFVRLAFAVAINVQPDILIVDEALAVGDLQFQAKCVTYMTRLFKTGVTVLLVTHDLSSVKNMCNKAIYLDRGEMIASGLAPQVVDLYAKKCRDEMTCQQDVLLGQTDVIRPRKDTGDIALSPRIFISAPDFAERVKVFRQGTRQAEVVNVQILDEEQETIDVVEFDQQIVIRIHIQFHEHCVLCVGYHLRDAKNVEILGSNTILESIGEISGKKGDQLVVDFKTRIPLMDGMYNVTVVLSKETVRNRAAVFIDCIENTAFLRVLENKESRIWNKVYLPNLVTISRNNEEVDNYGESAVSSVSAV